MHLSLSVFEPHATNNYGSTVLVPIVARSAMTVAITMELPMVAQELHPIVGSTTTENMLIKY